MRPVQELSLQTHGVAGTDRSEWFSGDRPPEVLQGRINDRRQVYKMIWIVMIVGIALDYFSKRWVLDTLTQGRVVDLIPGYLDFSYVENRGAAFGIFQGQIRILGVISLVMAALLLVYLLKKRDLHLLMKISLSLIVAGALGNAYDRFFYGFVVDFIHFHIREVWHFPTFNVADMCVVIGSGLMILYVLFIEGKDRAAEKESRNL